VSLRSVIKRGCQQLFDIYLRVPEGDKEAKTKPLLRVKIRAVSIGNCSLSGFCLSEDA